MRKFFNVKSICFFCFLILFEEPLCSEIKEGEWDVGYITNVEIHRRYTDGVKFIRINTSRNVTFIPGTNETNAENWIDGIYYPGTVYIPWDINDEVYSLALFSTLQKYVNDLSKKIVFYKIKTLDWEATVYNTSIIVYKFRVFNDI